MRKVKLLTAHLAKPVKARQCLGALVEAWMPCSPACFYYTALLLSHQIHLYITHPYSPTLTLTARRHRTRPSPKESKEVIGSVMSAQRFELRLGVLTPLRWLTLANGQSQK